MTDRHRIEDASARGVAMIKTMIEAQLGRQLSVIERQAEVARRNIARNEPMNAPSQRQQMAENLHQIIETACRAEASSKVTRVRITVEAGMKASNGKSSRLHEYALDPSLPDEERLKRATRRLAKKPYGYLRLAEAAARLAHLDLHQVIVDLVHGTRLAEGMDEISMEVFPRHLTLLADAIQGEARRIVKLTGLDKYFRTIEAYDLSPNGDDWDPDPNAFLWQWQAIPWINLVTEEVACVLGAAWHPKLGEDSYGPPQRKLVSVCHRIGLGLAPFGTGKSVRAFLVRRPLLVVTEFPQAGCMDFNRPSVVSIPFQNEWAHGRDGALRIQDLDTVAALSGVSSPYPGDEFEFFEVTPANLAEILETGLSKIWGMSDDAFDLPACAFTVAPPESRAAELERALFHGDFAEDTKTRLMTRLEAKAREYADGLRYWVTARTAEIEEALKRMAEYR